MAAATTCRVTQHCVGGVAGLPESMVYSGTALRSSPEAMSTDFAITPHGHGTMQLLLERQRPRPGAPRRTASSVSDDENRKAPPELFTAVNYEGPYVHGKRHGWGVLSRTWLASPIGADVEVWSTQTLKCSWREDVPQLLSDPCTIVEEEERNGSRRLLRVFAGLAMAVQDGARDAPSTARASGSPPNAAPMQQAVGGYSSGLAWALKTRFLPDAIGELIDYGAGTRYCGEFQCGLKHGFGVVTTLSSHSVTYIGLFDSNARHGAGTSIDEDRSLTFDGVWAEDGIAGGGTGTLHLPAPAPLAVQGQKWANATNVSSGFLVNVRSVHTGMWEPLLTALDEALPSLITSLEQLGTTLSNDDMESPASLPASPLFRRSGRRAVPSMAECAPSEFDEWQRFTADALAVFEPLRDASAQTRRDVERVRLTACHAMHLGVARRVLATFQRCFFFLFGSCGSRPIVETGAGGNQSDPGTNATSWCRMAAAMIDGFQCSHRSRGGSTISAATVSRAVQTASSLVMSMRLRLMMCHGAAHTASPSTSPQHSTRGAASTRRAGSMDAAHGSPTTTADVDMPEAQPALSARDRVLARTCAKCAHCALGAWISTLSAFRGSRGDVSSVLDSPGCSFLNDVIEHVLSGVPLQSSSSRLNGTTWDTVAASCVPLMLAVSRPAFARQGGQFRVAMRRVVIAAARLASKDSFASADSVAVAASHVLLPADLIAATAEARGKDVAGFEARIAVLSRVLAGEDSPAERVSTTDGDSPSRIVLQIITNAIRSAARTLIAESLSNPESIAEGFKAETTDVGPHFVFPTNSAEAHSASADGESSPDLSEGDERVGSRGSSSAGTRNGFVSSRVEAILRLVLFTRSCAVVMLDESSRATADDIGRLAKSLLVLACYFGSTGEHQGTELVPWLHTLLRIASTPPSVATILDDGVSICGHDALAHFEQQALSSEARMSESAKLVEGAVSIGNIPPVGTPAVVTFELSALGGWALHTFASVVHDITENVRGVVGVDPANSRAFTVLSRELAALFEDHLSVPASVLSSGCATRRSADEDVDELLLTPVQTVVPTASHLRSQLLSLGSVVEEFLAGGHGADGADGGSPSGSAASIDVEDPVMLAVLDWALERVGEASLAPVRPQSKVFPLRRFDPRQPDVGSDSDSDAQAKTPPPSASPLPSGVARELQPTFAPAASTVDSAMRRCYGGQDSDLRRLRLEPLKRLLAGIGIELIVVEGPVQDDTSPRKSRDDFGSPGLVNVDPSSALHLRIQLAPSGDETQPDEWVASRRGALRLAPVLVERLLAQWRRLRHRVELSVLDS